MNKPSKLIATGAIEKQIDLKSKYARMYAQTNGWDIPPEIPKPVAAKDQNSYCLGAWAVLEQMRQDGLLKEHLIDKFWKQVTK